MFYRYGDVIPTCSTGQFYLFLEKGDLFGVVCNASIKLSELKHVKNHRYGNRMSTILAISGFHDVFLSQMAEKLLIKRKAICIHYNQPTLIRSDVNTFYVTTGVWKTYVTVIDSHKSSSIYNLICNIFMSPRADFKQKLYSVLCLLHPASLKWPIRSGPFFHFLSHAHLSSLKWPFTFLHMYIPLHSSDQSGPFFHILAPIFSATISNCELNHNLSGLEPWSLQVCKWHLF